MRTIELPAGLAEMFDDLRTALQERAEPLENSAQGRDIEALIAEATKSVGKELMVFANSIGVRNFNARVFTFEEFKRAKKQQWRLCDVQPADPEFLAGGADNLRALMRGSMEHFEGKTISLWVHPMPVGDNEAFVAFVLHQDGMESVFALTGKHWSCMGLQGKSLEMLLSVLLTRRGSRTEHRWSAMVSAQKEVMRDDLREDIDEFMAAQGAVALTEERWEELLTCLYDRHHHLVLMQEVARSCGTPLLHESQRILGAMVHLIDNALESNTEKMAGIDKAHARALKRFQTDVLKFKAGRDFATNRLKVVEKELLGLKKQLLEVGTGNQPRTSEGSIGTALDRFFL